MTEITHQTAKQLLQVSADRPLPPVDRSALEAHLAACDDCNGYAKNLANLEVDLRSLMHRQWDAYRPSLRIQAIRKPSPVKLLWNNLFNQTQALGKLAVIAALLLGYFVIANITGVRVPIINGETATVLPTPNRENLISATSATPSIQTAITSFTSQACGTVSYIVQESDTLESIALRYGVTKEALLAYNSGDPPLAANRVFIGMELYIPVCEGTPSHTASVPSHTLTTPRNGTLLPEQPD